MILTNMLGFFFFSLKIISSSGRPVSEQAKLMGLLTMVELDVGSDVALKLSFQRVNVSKSVKTGLEQKSLCVPGCVNASQRNCYNKTGEVPLFS